jgi:hypothetical protein
MKHERMMSHSNVERFRHHPDLCDQGSFPKTFGVLGTAKESTTSREMCNLAVKLMQLWMSCFGDCNGECVESGRDDW